MKFSSLTFLLLLFSNYILSQNNQIPIDRISSSNVSQAANMAIDGNLNTYWESKESLSEKWLNVVMPSLIEINKVILHMEDGHQAAIKSYAIQTYINGRWENRAESEDNQSKEVVIELAPSVLNDRIRLSLFTEQTARVKEIKIYGKNYIAKDATPVKDILINQSGYNLNKPKRFTAAKSPNGTPFKIENTKTNKVVFEGVVNEHIGDFSVFNPQSSDEFIIKIDTTSSYPFRVGPFWLERVSYQNMIDFMIGARHYVGTTDKIRNHSWEWRDGDFFHWALQSLIAQYFSNPEAYKRLKKQVVYVENTSFPEEYKGKWGTLKPYQENAPDIVKLIHWDVDVKISQGLEHEHQKAELAHFLYAFPNLKEWLPQQNFDIVYDYVKRKWTKSDIAPHSTSSYDRSPEHNLLALKTKLGTFKGELPPGHSIIPNLMMYEVAKRQKEADAEKYFDAAFKQMTWMIDHLDWNNPMTTKGQRMSEHLTMRAFAFFYQQYPNRLPLGLEKKVEEWATIAIRRSHNMWDFRKFTDDGDWIPAGWNETGNILGFPAAALSAKGVIKDQQLRLELDRLIWSHFDNAFGRNPTGRHFSYDGPKEIEGVDQGWYSAHHGGIGLLEPVKFVFDGSPKTNHYPNHPAIGNFGWTEGWVQFNVAFNTSMAYLANSETEIELTNPTNKTLLVRLKAPINFDEKHKDQVNVNLRSSDGKSFNLVLEEEGRYSEYLSATLTLKKKLVKYQKQKIKIQKGDTLTVSYGLGYFEKSTSLVIK